MDVSYNTKHLSAYIEDFCCGLVAVGGFNCNQKNSSKEFWLWQLNDIKIFIDEEYFSEDEGEYEYIEKSVDTVMYCTVNGDQKYSLTGLWEALLEYGFEEKTSWKNPNTGNTVHFLLKEVK